MQEKIDITFLWQLLQACINCDDGPCQMCYEKLGILNETCPKTSIEHLDNAEIFANLLYAKYHLSVGNEVSAEEVLGLLTDALGGKDESN